MLRSLFLSILFLFFWSVAAFAQMPDLPTDSSDQQQRDLNIEYQVEQAYQDIYRFENESASTEEVKDETTWQTCLVEAVLYAGSRYGYWSFIKLSDYLVPLIAIFLALWIVFKIMQVVVFPDPKQPFGFILEIAGRVFAAMVGVSLLIMGPKAFFDWTFNPMIEASIDYGYLVMDASKKDNSLLQPDVSCISSFNASDEEKAKLFCLPKAALNQTDTAFPIETEYKILCLTKSVTASFSNGIDFGLFLMTESWSKLTKWEFPDINLFLFAFGFLIFLAFFVLFLVFVAFFVEAILRIAIAALLAPIAIVAWVFPMTREFPLQVFQMVLQTIFTLAIICVVIALVDNMMTETLRTKLALGGQEYTFIELAQGKQMIHANGQEVIQKISLTKVQKDDLKNLVLDDLELLLMLLAAAVLTLVLMWRSREIAYHFSGWYDGAVANGIIGGIQGGYSKLRSVAGELKNALRNNLRRHGRGGRGGGGQEGALPGGAGAGPGGAGGGAGPGGANVGGPAAGGGSLSATPLRNVSLTQAGSTGSTAGGSGSAADQLSPGAEGFDKRQAEIRAELKEQEMILSQMAELMDNGQALPPEAFEYFAENEMLSEDLLNGLRRGNVTPEMLNDLQNKVKQRLSFIRQKRKSLNAFAEENVKDLTQSFSGAAGDKGSKSVVEEEKEQEEIKKEVKKELKADPAIQKFDIQEQYFKDQVDAQTWAKVDQAVQQALDENNPNALALLQDKALTQLAQEVYENVMKKNDYINSIEKRLTLHVQQKMKEKAGEEIQIPYMSMLGKEYQDQKIIAEHLIEIGKGRKRKLKEAEAELQDFNEMRNRGGKDKDAQEAYDKKKKEFERYKQYYRRTLKRAGVKPRIKFNED